jgi:hypothetical protein
MKDCCFPYIEVRGRDLYASADIPGESMSIAAALKENYLSNMHVYKLIHFNAFRHPLKILTALFNFRWCSCSL